VHNVIEHSNNVRRYCERARRALVHTVLMLLPIAIASVASWYQHGLPNANVPGISSRLSSYITVLVQEWFVVLLIRRI
jgi:hypothetical protein